MSDDHDYKNCPICKADYEADMKRGNPMTSDIVTAEVVEVERPKRSAMWFGLQRSQDGLCWRAERVPWIREEAAVVWAEDAADRRIVVHVPAEDAPAAATRVADAESVRQWIQRAREDIVRVELESAIASLNCAEAAIAALKGA